MLTTQNLLLRLSELELTLQAIAAKEKLGLDLDSKSIEDLENESMFLGVDLATVTVYKVDVFQDIVDNILMFNSSIHELLIYGYKGYKDTTSHRYNPD